MRFTCCLRLVVAAGLAVTLSTSACRRKRDPDAAPAPSPSATPATAPAAGKPAATPNTPAAKPPEPVPDSLPTAPPDSSLRFPVNKELTGAIHLYLTDYQKMPADFETLVKGKYLKALPKPPPGKRFALDRNRMQVVVLD